MAQIIDGKKIGEEIRSSLKERIEVLKNKGIIPSLATILVGNNPASITYVKNKNSACQALGIRSSQYNLKEDISEDELISFIKKLNEDKDIHGILVQLPLPKHINENRVLETILPDKDVDGFHYYNVGRFFSFKDFYKMREEKLLLPCTPSGIMELLMRSSIKIEGASCVVLGRSNIVGKPIAMLLLAANATVTICHSKTKNISDICRQADILVAAIGKPKFVKEHMVKDGACVIDVGINRIEDKIVGDVDFDEVDKKAGFITPVPGGVGPMTVTMLLVNTIVAAENYHGK